MKPFDLTQLSVLSLVIKSLVPFLISLPSKTALPFDSSHLLVQDSPGLRWDAIHYASIALDGYRYEQQGAFMPLWLGMMRLSGEVLAYLRGRDSVGVGEVLLGGQYLNILMNAGAVMMLYKWVREILQTSQPLRYRLISPKVNPVSIPFDSLHINNDSPVCPRPDPRSIFSTLHRTLLRILHFPGILPRGEGQLDHVKSGFEPRNGGESYWGIQHCYSRLEVDFRRRHAWKETCEHQSELS
jgi:hypothetical protein